MLGQRDDRSLFRCFDGASSFLSVLASSLWQMLTLMTQIKLLCWTDYVFRHPQTPSRLCGWYFKTWFHAAKKTTHLSFSRPRPPVPAFHSSNKRRMEGFIFMNKAFSVFRTKKMGEWTYKQDLVKLLHFIKIPRYLSKWAYLKWWNEDRARS